MRAIGRKTAKMQTGDGLRRSHKQQLALMSSLQSGPQRRAGRPDIDGRGHMSTADARVAIGEGWFVLDPHRQSVQDSGLDTHLSSRGARRQLDADFGPVGDWQQY